MLLSFACGRVIAYGRRHLPGCHNVNKQIVILCCLSTYGTLNTHAASISIGAAPKGDATKIASRIIKYNFPKCKRVSAATRAADGSIRATCDGRAYLVFTMYSAAEGKMVELAMDCAAARNFGVSGC